MEWELLLNNVSGGSRELFR